MKKTINCFIPYMDERAAEKTITALKENGIVNKIYLLTTTTDTTLPLPEGCEILPVNSLTDSETMKEIAEKANSPYLLLYSKTGPLQLGYMALERMVDYLQGSDCGMVYADHYECKNGEVKKHPVIDYQEGSVRDDFDFGSLLLFDYKYFTAATYDLNSQQDYKYAALYAIRLFISRHTLPVHIKEYLYTEIENDNRLSGEKQFDYVNPRNREVQIEMENAFTHFLKKSEAYLSPTFQKVDLKSGIFDFEASVIIPVKNRARTIDDAIRSALEQKTTFPFNVIVVDNHSTDGTSEIIGKYVENNKVIHLQPERTDLGIGGCWNLAANHLQCGRFAVQLDSDDLYSSENTLQTIVDAFNEQHCAMLVGTYRMTDFDLNTMAPGIIDHKEWTAINGHNNALRINGLGAPRAFFTPLLREIKVPNTSYGEDYALGLAFSRNYKIGRIYDELYLCRRWEGNSDASLDIEHTNANNLYKDSLRTREMKIRKAMNHMDDQEQIQRGKKVNHFIKQQLNEWELAGNNHKALANIKSKTVDVNNFIYSVQYNPNRIVSTTAQTDAANIKQRPCFLCEANRPKEQRKLVLEYAYDFHLCVNPYPILSKHLTIPCDDHMDQRIKWCIPEFYNLLEELPKDFAIFYNGPCCGASAPDHLHFQAALCKEIPLITQYDALREKAIHIDSIYTLEDTDEFDQFEFYYHNIYYIDSHISPFFIIEENINSEDIRMLHQLLNVLPTSPKEVEPMVNILVWRQDDKTITVIIPRKKHRPYCYSATGDAQLLVSPGTLDMAGVIVTPREEDFNKITADDIEQIMKEVSLDASEIQNIACSYPKNRTH